MQSDNNYGDFGSNNSVSDTSSFDGGGANNDL